jgi:exonuclease III
MSVLAVYAPCEQASRPAFFEGPLLDALLVPHLLHSHVIMAGDFNCVLSQLDVQPAPGQQPGTSARLRGGQELQLACDAACVVDAWRSTHPLQREYAHQQQGQHASGGRIDAIWLSG